VVSRNDVVEFLFSLKDALQIYELLVPNRHENTQALFDLDISAVEREDVLLSLTPDDYVSGPEEDHMFPDRPNRKDPKTFGS